MRTTDLRTCSRSPRTTASSSLSQTLPPSTHPFSASLVSVLCVSRNYAFMYLYFMYSFHVSLLRYMASKLYGVNATIIIFVFVLYCIAHEFHVNASNSMTLSIDFLVFIVFFFIFMFHKICFIVFLSSKIILL